MKLQLLLDPNCDETVDWTSAVAVVSVSARHDRQRSDARLPKALRLFTIILCAF